MCDPAELQQSQNLSMFLATQNKIRDSLKDKLRLIPNYEELLCDVVNTCVKMYEDKYYLLSSEKHMFVKVCVCGIDLSSPHSAIAQRVILD